MITNIREVSWDIMDFSASNGGTLEQDYKIVRVTQIEIGQFKLMIRQ